MKKWGDWQKLFARLHRLFDKTQVALFMGFLLENMFKEVKPVFHHQIESSFGSLSLYD